MAQPKSVQTISLKLDQITVAPGRRPVRELATLTDSIVELGLLSPITVTTDHRLIAGRHRLEACRSLGWKTIPAFVVAFDELKAELAEIDENLVRNELTVLERSEQLARRKRVYEAMHPETKHGGSPGKPGGGKKAKEGIMPSFAKDTASKTGSSTTTVKREVQIANSITAPVKEAIRNTPVADSKTDLMQLAKLDEPEQEAVAKVIAGGKAKNVKDAVKIVRREQKAAEEEIAVSAPRDTSAYRLIQCPLAEVALDDMQADWIITDPPYPKDFLSLYDDLASFAEQHLKPGGSLLALVGQSYLPEVMARLTGRLRYQWTLAYLTPGGQSVQLWDRHVNTFWKPVLWFVKGEYKGNWIGDVVKSDPNDNDKKHHHWGQSESGMADLIRRFTKPGELIIDPFLGGGTTGVVAVQLGRRFIGIDIDEQAIETSARRLEASLSA